MPLSHQHPVVALAEVRRVRHRIDAQMLNGKGRIFATTLLRTCVTMLRQARIASTSSRDIVAV